MLLSGSSLAVERNLAKVEVEGSIPFSRSKKKSHLLEVSRRRCAPLFSYLFFRYYSFMRDSNSSILLDISSEVRECMFCWSHADFKYTGVVLA